MEYFIYNQMFNNQNIRVSYTTTDIPPQFRQD
jgi:hypothetical protein